MLIATFAPTTAWVGKTITREGDVFILEDHGPITAADVMAYDSQGHLVWANDGTRAWVGSQALRTPTAPRQGPQRVEKGAAPASSPSEGATGGKRATSAVGLLSGSGSKTSTSDLQVCGNCGATSLMLATCCGECGHELSRAHVYVFSGVLVRWFATVLDLLVVSVPVVVVAALANASDEVMQGMAGLAVLIWLPYAVACEAVWGRTVGKRLLGSRVLTVEEKSIGVGRSLVRNLFKIVGMLGILQLVTLVTILASKRSQRIGDMVAGTIVVTETGESAARARVTEDIGLLS